MKTKLAHWIAGRILRVVVALCSTAALVMSVHADNTVQVNVGESVTIKAAHVAKLAVADPAIADVLPLSDTEISVIGKKAGVTTLTIVHDDGAATEHHRIEVGLSAGVRSIHEALEAPGVSVREIGEAIVLEGKVDNEQQAERIAKIASAYKANVVNLLEVTRPRQVRIKTRLVEVRTDALKQLGVDYFGANGEVVYKFGYGMVEGSSLLGSGFFNPQQSGDETISASSVPAAVEARLRALAVKDAARILSEPTLVTLSGKEASFLSGGEVPIVQQLAQSFTVEFKEFGVRMKIKPVVDSENNVATHILAEVSEVASAPTAGIPTFRTRRAETNVQMKDGQTLVIGGLLSNQHNRDAIRKVPWLGDIPVLGLLFRSKDYQAGQSELLVFVTPEVIQDVDADTAKAGVTPAMKKWNGTDADRELLKEQKPAPKWMKPLEVDELSAPEEPATKPAAAVDGAATSAVAPATGEAPAPATNFEPARPAQP